MYDASESQRKRDVTERQRECTSLRERRDKGESERDVERRILGERQNTVPVGVAQAETGTGTGMMQMSCEAVRGMSRVPILCASSVYY
jgi:hypothetical protein